MITTDGYVEMEKANQPKSLTPLPLWIIMVSGPVGGRARLQPH